MHVIMCQHLEWIPGPAKQVGLEGKKKVQFSKVWGLTIIPETVILPLVTQNNFKIL
jgi:predicted transcriptional regulator